MTTEVRIVQALLIGIGLILVFAGRGAEVVALLQWLVRYLRGEEALKLKKRTRSVERPKSRRTTRKVVPSGLTPVQVQAGACLKAFERTAHDTELPQIDADADDPDADDPVEVPESFQALAAQLDRVRQLRVRRKESPSQALRRLQANEKLNMIRLQTRLNQRAERPPKPYRAARGSRGLRASRVKGSKAAPKPNPAPEFTVSSAESADPMPLTPTPLSLATPTPVSTAVATPSSTAATSVLAQPARTRPVARKAARVAARPSSRTRTAPPASPAKRAKAAAKELLALARELRTAGDAPLAASVSEALAELQRAFLIVPCAGDELWARLDDLSSQKVADIRE